MRYASAILLVVLTVLPVSAFAQKRTGPHPVQLSGIADIAGRTCNQEEYARTFTKANDSAVRLYGYELLAHPWMCRVLSTHWMKEAKVVRLREIAADVDDYHDMTLMLIPGDGRPWVIPTMEGMTEPLGLANRRHNRVAFDVLLRANRERPTKPAGWVSLALLYLNVIGHDVRVADSTQFGAEVRGLRSRSYELRRLGLLPTYRSEGKSRTVVVNDLYGAAHTHRYTRWTLTFTVHADDVRLAKVEGKTEKLLPRQLGSDGR